MGLFGKSKKEMEIEAQEAWYQKNYGISRTEANFIKRDLKNCFSTDNLDLLIKLKAPIFTNIVKNISSAICDNNKKLNRIEEKYNALLDAVNKQNELLSMLVERKNSNENISLRR